MFTVYYILTDAMPVVIVGMLVLWAAASRRHWFIRTAVIGATILTALLIPAFEVVIELAVQCALVVLGLAIWKRRRQRSTALPRDAASSVAASSRLRFRMSIETLLLATAVVAVITAVVARAPHLTVWQANGFVANGMLAATVCLACVWVVCGGWQWPLRLVALPALAVLLSVALIVLNAIGYYVSE